jgi:putative transposase
MNQDFLRPKSIFMRGQKKVKKFMVQFRGKREKRENLITGKRKHQKDLISPLLLTGSRNAKTFEQWLEIYLIPNLNIPSVLIMDKAAIHGKKVIKEIGENAGHEVLFLPTYSPDLNDREGIVFYVVKIDFSPYFIFKYSTPK